MESWALEIGGLYGFRENPRAATPLIKVRLLDKVGRKGKLKIRFEDGPHPGLEEYVSSRQIVVAWSGRKAFLRDEEREAALAAHGRKVASAALDEAISMVLASSGEPSAGAGGGMLYMAEDELQRIADRAGVSEELTSLHPLAFRGRQGWIHLPQEAAEIIARAFAAAEPQTVMLYIDDQETELHDGGFTPGERYKHDLLRQYLPGWAIARQWAGVDQEAQMLRQEIARLRTLVGRAIVELKLADKEGKARALERALDGR